jgi:hypothetical protein
MGGILLAGGLLGGKMTASAVPTSLSWTSIGNPPSPPVTVIASGAPGPVTFAWTIQSNDEGFPVTINSPADATTTFVFNVFEGDTGHAVARCTVTSGGQSAFVDVPLSYREKSVNENNNV